MADPNHQTLRGDNPKLQQLLSAGWQVVSESWGARMVISDDILARCQAKQAPPPGWVVRELDATDTTQAAALQGAVISDFPITFSSFGVLTAAEQLKAEMTAGNLWLFGAFDAANQLGCYVAFEKADQYAPGLIDIANAATLPAARGLGLAKATAAFGILTLAKLGHRLYGAGGAAQNTASLALVKSLGGDITENYYDIVSPEAVATASPQYAGTET